MSEIKNTPKITDDEIVNKVRDAIEHRATWMGLMFDEAKKAGVDFEPIGRAAISRCGHFHGINFNSLKSADTVPAFKEAFLNELGQKLFEMEITKCDDEELKVEFHYCALVNAWVKQGFDPKNIEVLCDMAMDGDRGIAAENNLDFTLGDTIAAGCPTCSLTFKRK